MPQTNNQLIELLKEGGVLKNKAIEKAMLACPREYFVPQRLKNDAYGNYPLPIGQGQTISQPLTVIFMLELLKVKPGQKVLEIGYGSGWQTAMLSYLAGAKGHIYAFEIKERVGQFGKQNLTNFCTNNLNHWYKNYALFEGGYDPKFLEYAPYDRIISGAAFSQISQDLIDTLTVKGRLVAPTQHNDIRVISKDSKESIREQIIPGFVFVPITSTQTK